MSRCFVRDQASPLYAIPRSTIQYTARPHQGKDRYRHAIFHDVETTLGPIILLNDFVNKVSTLADKTIIYAPPSPPLHLLSQLCHPHIGPFTAKLHSCHRS